MNDKELSPRCGAHATSEAPADAESFPAPDAAQRLKRLLAETAARIADRSREAAAQSPDVQKTQDAEPAGEAPSLRLDLGRPLVTEEEALLLAEAPAEHTLAILELGGLARALLLPNPSYRCGIINAKSGRCPENCAFCAQSKFHRTNAPEYPMVDAEKLEAAALRLEREGVRRFGIVTSGRGPSNKDIEALASALEGMRGKTRIGFCASLGILNDERAQALAAAGFTRYHHNLETSRTYFPRICSTHDYELDVETVRTAQRAGMSVCSGGLFGLGESWRDRIELAFTLSALKVDSMPINFLIPIPGTRLEKMPPLEPAEALRIIAIMRLVNPLKDIVICGGRNQILGDRWETWVYAAGANVVMTGDYLTRPGNAFEKDRAAAAAIGAEPGC